MKRILLAGAVGVLALSLAACGKSVQAGNVGIKIDQFGSNAGVQATPLQTGWHGTGWGESILEYPTITRTYQWTAGQDGDSRGNEELTFNTSEGATSVADVAVTVAVDPSKAPAIYQKYRLDFADLLNGPIRAQVRVALASETEKMKIEDMIAGGRERAIGAALADVQHYFAGSGVEVSQLQWLGAIRYPATVMQSITAKANVDQATQRAVAQEAQADAEAQVKIKTAQGEAKANELIAESIRANPEIVKLKAVEKWDGHLPTVTGANTPMIDLK